jgi:predicted amidohydrolase YtcJ
MNQVRPNLLFPIAAILALTSNPVAAATALHDIAGYTSSDNGIVAFTVLVFDDDGRVLATGDEQLLEAWPDATRIDGGGRTVLPGLIDAHAHVSGLGFLQTNLDVTGIGSLEATVNAISQYAKDKPHARWITGRGWNQVLWSVKEFPTAADIDAVVAGRPVWLRRIDGHAGWANSAAMKLAGIDDDTPDPVGGKIIRDDNGHATGVFVDMAMDIVEAQVPQPDKADTRAAIKAAAEVMLSEGLTGVHDAGVDLQTAEVYMAMADDAELDIRVYAMTGGAGDVLDAIGEPIYAYGNDHLEISSVKLYSDGALGSRGAAMIEPYDDDPENRGLAFWTQDELDAQVLKANGMGFQVGIHAIGDLGNRMSLNAYEKAQGGKPSPLRNRIEHSQIVTLADIPRFAELGIIASMQATHATSDMNMAEDRVGPERILGGYAWRRMLEAGVVLANGSDFPVELSNPFHGLYASVTRQDRGGKPDGGWYADQALTRAEALHSYTLAPAFAARQEDRMGSLEPGKWADFIVIDRNYFEVPADQIDDIVVLEAWVAGQKVFDRQDPAE